jgi:hypothetical protein
MGTYRAVSENTLSMGTSPFEEPLVPLMWLFVARMLCTDKPMPPAYLEMHAHVFSVSKMPSMESSCTEEHTKTDTQPAGRRGQGDTQCARRPLPPHLHVHQKARRQLRPRRAGVEQRRRRMDEEPAGHERVRFECRVQVLRDTPPPTAHRHTCFTGAKPPAAPMHMATYGEVNADRHAHEHVLWPLGDGAIHPRQVRLLQRFEAEVVEPVHTPTI